MTSGWLATRTLLAMETGVTTPGGQQADDGRAQPDGVAPARRQGTLSEDRAQRWLARLSFVFAGLAIVVLLVFAGLRIP